MDLEGGGNITPSFEGAKYYLIITDDYTRYRWIRFLSQKSQALQELKNFAIYQLNQTGLTIKAIRSDDSSEFDSKESKLWVQNLEIQ